MIPGEVLAVLDVKFAVILPHLDERQRRLYLASEAEALGHGGIAAVARLAEVSESTVARGYEELAAGAAPLGRVRRAGGGRKSAAERDPGLVSALESLIEPRELGDPVSPLRWTTASLRDLSRELAEAGHPVSAPVVGGLLRAMGFSLQGMAKTRSGSQAPDRDAQFRHLNSTVERFLAGACRGECRYEAEGTDRRLGPPRPHLPSQRPADHRPGPRLHRPRHPVPHL